MLRRLGVQMSKSRKEKVTCNEFIEIIKSLIEEIGDEDIFPDRLQEDF